MPTFTVVFLSKRISSSSVAYFKYFSSTTRRLDQSLTLTHTARLLVWWYRENIPSSPPQYRNRWLSILHSSVNDIELTLSSDFFFSFFNDYDDLKHDPKRQISRGGGFFTWREAGGKSSNDLSSISHPLPFITVFSLSLSVCRHRNMFPIWRLVHFNLLMQVPSSDWSLVVTKKKRRLRVVNSWANAHPSVGNRLNCIQNWLSGTLCLCCCYSSLFLPCW